jgi:predicted RNase H-like HicB family nuclease
MLNMKKNNFLVLIEKDEDGMLIASVPALKGCHTQAKKFPTLFKRIKEAIKVCIDVEKQDFPRLEFVGMQEIEIAK